MVLQVRENLAACSVQKRPPERFVSLAAAKGAALAYTYRCYALVLFFRTTFIVSLLCVEYILFSITLRVFQMHYMWNVTRE
jgi:hypothetical protein